MTIAMEEIFGQVLSVIEVKDFEQAVKMDNAVDFGLSSSIYTSSMDKALTFLERTEAGLPETGKTGIEFFSRHKVIYIKYR